MINMVKLPTNNKRMILRVARGHFATSHSHINYYIDVTMQKTRLSEAAETAKELVHMYKSTTIVDTILCLDGTQVIGTCMANELTKDGFRNMNAHQTIYIITPEYTSGSQIILRDNIAPMVSCRPPSPPATPSRRPWRRCSTTAGRWRAWRPSSPPPTSSWGCGSTPSLTPTTCPTTRATSPGTAPCAKPASPLTLW